jgi:Putative transposase
MIVPGGGFSLDGSSWVACRPAFLLSVLVLSRLFRRLCLEQLVAAHDAGCLQFFGNRAALADRKAFLAYLAPLHDTEWVVYAKKPFGGPEQVLRYMARYTHRVAIANSRLVAIDHEGVSFKWKDYRVEGPARNRVMTLAADEFIRRFLIHVLPTGFHRIRHYGLFANNRREQNIARARQLLNAPAPQPSPAATGNGDPDNQKALPQPCPCCGGRMIVIEIFARGTAPRHRPTPPTRTIRLDTS